VTASLGPPRPRLADRRSFPALPGELRVPEPTRWAAKMFVRTSKPYSADGRGASGKELTHDAYEIEFCGNQRGDGR
jgi:hypothetical protein